MLTILTGNSLRKNQVHNAIELLLRVCRAAFQYIVKQIFINPQRHRFTVQHNINFELVVSSDERNLLNSSAWAALRELSLHNLGNLLRLGKEPFLRSLIG
ncbi:MAG: hypothetical protein ACRD6I_07885 [Candidatus Acidiferrales bacterium]